MSDPRKLTQLKQAERIFDKALEEIRQLGVKVSGTSEGYMGDEIKTSQDAVFELGDE